MASIINGIIINGVIASPVATPGARLIASPVIASPVVVLQFRGTKSLGSLRISAHSRRCGLIKTLEP